MPAKKKMSKEDIVNQARQFTPITGIKSQTQVKNTSRKTLSRDKVRLSTDTITKIIDVHRNLDRLFHFYFEQYNITSVQIPVLMTLLKHKKLMVSELASLLNIGSSNITPLCKRLEKSGLIVRTRDTVDQRVVYVRLTKAALGMMEEISHTIRTLNDRENDEYANSDEDVVTIRDGVDVLYGYTSNLLTWVTDSMQN